jgi:hypothetical protein
VYRPGGKKKGGGRKGKERRSVGKTAPTAIITEYIISFSISSLFHGHS